jgi:hypothetical protein
MNIIYVCMICRNKSIMNIIYRFISLADSGKRNSVLHGAVYSVSSELIQYNAATIYQVQAYKKKSVGENGREHRGNLHISVAHLVPSLRTNNMMRR